MPLFPAFVCFASRRTGWWLCFLLLAQVVAAQVPKPCRVCVQYATREANRQSQWRLYENNRYLLAQTLAARDTCLQFTLQPGATYLLELATELAETVTLRWQADTLAANHVFKLLVRDKITELKEVTIRPEERFSRRGDTLFINTEGVPTQPHADATALFDKIPGLSLSGSGQLSILGEGVRALTVDGLPLFGGNALATLNALRADMIARLEVVERVEADGRTTRTVNVQLKPNRKNGLYGDLAATSGSFGRWGAATRLNRLRPGQFYNAFAGYNNFNQRAFSELDYLQMMQRSWINDVAGVASVVDANEGRLGAASPSTRARSLDATDWMGSPPGVSRSFSGGLSTSRSTRKSEFGVYVLAERRHTELTTQTNRLRWLLPLRQAETSLADQSQARYAVSAGLNGRWSPSARLTLRVSNQTHLGQHQNDDQLTQTATLTNDSTDGPPLQTSSLTQHRTRQGRELRNQLRLQLTKKYERPGRLTSIYLNQYTGLGADLDTYRNQQMALSGALANHNRIDLVTNEFSTTAEVLHGEPLNKQWLVEVRGKTTWESFGYQQTGAAYEAATADFTRPVPGLTAPFATTDQTWQAQANVLWKRRKLNVIAGAALWHWHSRRTADEAVPTRAVARWLPRASVDYRVSSVTRVSLQGGLVPILPAPSQLFPLPDSANLQLVTLGNPLLTYSLQPQVSFRFSTVFGSRLNFSATLRWQRTQQPVYTQNWVSALGVPTLTYGQQPSLATQGLSANFVLINVKLASKLTWFLFGMANWQENLQGAGPAISRLRSLHSYVMLSAKYIHSDKFFVGLDGQWSVFGQSTPQSHAFTLQQTYRLKSEWNFAQRWYATPSLNLAMVNGTTTSGRPVAIGDVELSRFLFKNNKLKATVAVYNLLNQRNLPEVSQTATEQVATLRSRLPRFIALRLTVFPEIWF
jgi:hypothetical protein